MGNDIDKAYRRAYYRQNRETCINAVARHKARNKNDPKVQAMAAALREGRKAMGMTQKELGAAIGANTNVVGFWEQGQLRPNADRIGAAFPELAEAIRRAGDEALKRR